MSVPEVQTPSKAADPAAVEPTATANVVSTDPVQSTGTDPSIPESRPEGTNNNATEGATATGTADETVSKDALPKDAVTIEAPPITEGIINYKGPGFLKSLILQKKYFWFSDEPLEYKHLSNYLSSEKADIAHRNAAHATQTGKGLLYYAKRAEDKGHPAGILNLGELTDFVKGTMDVFSFKINGQKHTFQAPSRAERDSWIATIQTKSSEAKAAHEGVVGSQGYKSQLEKLAKPAGAAAGTTTKSRSRSKPNRTTESKASEPAAAVTGGEPARSGSSSDEAKTKSKSRSQSGKRTSIFGTLRAKKEEHDEKKEIKKEEKAEQKEEKAEDKAIKQEVEKEDETEKKTEKEEATLAKKEATTTEPLDAAGIAARVVGSPVEPAGGSQAVADTAGVTNSETAPASEAVVTSPTEPATGSSTRETAPKPTKRTSIFGNFFKKDTASPSSPTETAPAAPTKDAEAAVTSPTAPQIEDPVTSKNGETGTAEPSTAAAAETSAVSTAPDSGKPARRSSFFDTLGTKKERKPDATSDAEAADGEGKKASSKFGGLFRKPSRAVPNGKTPTTESTPGTEALKAAVEAPASTKDTPAISNGTETVPESTTGQTQTPVQASA